MADLPERPPQSSKTSRKSSEHVHARYEPGTEIGRGGMGRVVEATDTVLGRVVAVKEVLGSDEDARRRFARETKITARLEHPSIVPVYDAGVTAAGTPYYVMRKVSGRRLEDLVAEADTLQQRLALVPRLIAAIQAIAHAHARGIVHRDLKPANILFGDHGETVVIDWGLARAVDEPDEDGPVEPHPIDAKDSLRTRIGTVFGTPGFMSAEQLCGEPVDARSDVYALGATMYFLLSRRVPHFGGNNEAIMKAAAEGPPVPIGELVPDVPPELSTIVDKALAYRHADRYADAAALGEDLQQFLTGRLVASHRYTRLERIARFVRRHRVAVAAVTIALVALVVGGTVAIRSVLVERDRADDQARVASERQHDAEAAGARERERADQLLLAQAELILPTDPTAAIAMLKQLAAKPASWHALWRQARAIAADARVEGVAWGLPGPTTPRALEIAPGGTRAIVVGDDDSLHLYELAARTHRPIATDLRRIGATFADDGHLVIYNERAIEIVDLATDARTSIAAPDRIEHLRAAGDWLAWSDPTRAMWQLANGAPQRLTTEPAEHFEFAPDGSRLLVAGRSALAIYTRLAPGPTNVGPGGASWVAWDPASRTVAATYRGQVVRRRLDAPASETFLLDDPSGRPIVLPGVVTVIGSAGLHSLPATRFAPAFHDVLDIGAGLHAAPNGRIVAVTGNRLVVIEGEISSEIRMPVVGHVRIAASPRSRFTIVASAGHLLIYDLDAMYPRPRELTDDVAAFARVGAGDFLLVTQEMRWAWLDASGRRTPISTMLPALAPIGVSRSTERVLVMDPGAHTGWILRKPDRVHRLTGNVTYGILRDDNTAIVATIEGDVATIASDFTRTVVMSHRSEPVATTYAGSWLATAYADKTLVRRDLSSPSTAGAQNVLHLGAVPRPGTMRQTADGRVFIPIGNTIQCWQLDGSLRAHVTLPGPISEVVGMDRYQLVRTEDKSGYVIDLETPGRVSGAIPTGAISRSVSAAERLAVVEIPGAAPTLVDLESGHHWRLSRRRPGFQLIYAAIADDGQTVAALDTNKLLLWNLDLPHDAESTAAWLDKLTNASAELGPTTMTWH